MLTVPVCIRSATRSARPMSRVKTLPFRPSGPEFAQASASSSSENTVTGATGPNVSSRFSFIVVVTRSMTVGR
jgi:hypothetical protein